MMLRSVPLLFATLLALGAAAPAAAQSAAERATLVALRDSLAGVSDSFALKEVERGVMARARQFRDSTLLHLRLGFLAIRLGELGGKKHFDDAASEFQWATDLQPQWPWPWFGLGLAELGVGDSEVSIVAGLQSMLGRDALTRSANAFARSAEVEPSFVAGLVELSNTAVKQLTNIRMDVALAALRRAAQTPAGRHPDVLLARARVEREVGHPDSALVAIDALVARAPRQASALLEQAKVRFALTRLDGNDPWYRGLVAADAATLAAYRSDLEAIVPDSTLAAFDAARPESRAAVARRFFEGRDRDELHRPGERLREHYRRLDHARRNYRLVSRNRQYDIAERYKSSQKEYDDRGVIYLRHGEPDARATYAAPGVEPNESWRYRRESGDLLFHFVARQDVQDYRLVESVMDVLGFSGAVAQRDLGLLGGVAAAEARDSASLLRSEIAEQLIRSREGMSPIYSRMLSAGRSGGGQMQGEERRQGQRSIAQGTRTDSWPLRWTKDLPARIEVVAVGTDSAGPVVQFAFAIPGSALQPVQVGGTMTYQVRMRAVVIGVDGNQVAALDTVRRFATRGAVPPGEHLLGRLPLRVPPGDYTIRAAIEAGDAGTTTLRDTIRVNGVEGTSLGLSGLAVGTRAVALAWRTGPADTAWINPLRTYRRSEPARLHFEVTGLPKGAKYRTEVAVVRPKGGGLIKSLFGGGGTAMRFTFEGVHPGGIEAVHRELSLERVEPGNYVLEVTVIAGNHRATSRRDFIVVK